MNRKFRWKRLRATIRRKKNAAGMINLADGHLAGADRVISYMNGYAAASKGRRKNDYTGAELAGAAVHIVWWFQGWQDRTDGKRASPYEFARQQYEKAIARMYSDDRKVFVPF